MKWSKGQTSIKDIKFISNTYQTPLLLSTILARRNIIEREDVMFYLENDLTYLHSPFAFNEMENFVERIEIAKERKEKVAIHGDRDVDGITSTSLLYNALKKENIDVCYYVPVDDEPYGLTKKGIDNDVKNNINLIITVDCGISSVEETDYANSKNIDVIVIDHHIPGDVLPDTVATINPKIKDSGYPFDGLSACSVVSKCIWAINFSKTPFYSQPLVLLALEKEKDFIRIEASLFKNMHCISSFTELFIPGKTNLEKSQIYSYCTQGYPLYCYEQEVQKQLLRAVFGVNTNIILYGLQNDIVRHIKSLEGLSFNRIKTKSKAIKYFYNSNIKLLEFLFKAYIFREFKSLGDSYDDDLDLVAISTICDLMPLENENRILVRRGLKTLEKSKREGLTELLLNNKMIGKRLTTTDISWGLGPIINSSGRMGQANVAIDMLCSSSTKEIQEKTELLLSLNRQRKKLGDDIWPSILKKAKESYEETGSKLAIVFDPKLARGITGIMASRVLQELNCPVVIISQVDENSLIASGRSKEGFNIREFFSNFSSLFEDFGGHSCAGGFSMDKKNLDKLLSSVKDYCDTHTIDFDQEEDLVIDATIPHKYMQTNLIELAEKFEPYGNNCEPLKFLTENMVVKNAIVMNNSKENEKDHLRLSLECNNIIWSALWWKAADKLDNEFKIGDKVDVVYKLGRNYFRQQETIQLTILDLKQSK